MNITVRKKSKKEEKNLRASMNGVPTQLTKSISLLFTRSNEIIKSEMAGLLAYITYLSLPI
jgi:hypothetical protein